MATIDTMHANYTVPIAEEQRKYLRFIWNDKLYQYTCFPNGISCAQRIYTKLMKPVYATLRQKGHTNTGYIHDSLLAADFFEECQTNIKDTVHLMTHVGFAIHEEKSVVLPTTKICFWVIGSIQYP